MSLHGWRTSAILGLVALVIWFIAFFWYFYGAHRMTDRLHTILVRLRLVRD